MSTPANRPSDAGAFSHRALVYGSDEQYLAGAVPFLHAGLAAGQACMALTTPANLALLRAHLPQAGPAVEFADPAAWYTTSPGAMLASLDRCIRDHEQQGRPVRILGGPRWTGLGHLARRAWQRYESVLNPGFAGRRAALLCAYDTRTLDPDILAAARRTHPVLSSEGRDTPSGDYLDPAAFCAGYDSEPLPAPTGPVAEMRFTRDDLAATRAFTLLRAESAGLAVERAGDLVLAVGEVTTNAVRYAGGRGRLRAWREDHSLVFEVTDDGDAPLDPLAGWLPPQPATRYRRGLWLARQLADLVETRHGSGWQVRLYTAVS